ncbi:aldehyde dehydrogenase family 3 member A2-like [Diadema antillarum]|uniref:aldehyde dehydrogenase family 3 member A2-like n=1 Tax=Diadema antillarum TaxID=105358 RepID=UPI003A840E70
MATVNAAEVVEKVRAAFRAGKTRSCEARIRHLKNCQRMMRERRQDFIDALRKDLRKPAFETDGFEILLAENEAVQFLDQVEEWTQPQKVPTNMVTFNKVAYNLWEPLGVSLIIGAWNYPFQLIMEPLLAAIVAGNTAVIKPSELSPATAELFEKVLPEYLDNDCYQVVNGDAAVATALLAQRFDHILYTGNTTVAKIVMAAAAKHLTPLTLELGGKSPCYIDRNSDLEISGRRATWGRFVNCGQTCIAPDYVLCHPILNDKLLEVIRKSIKDFFGADPQKHPDYARIVNKRHFKRISAMLEGQTIAIGGRTDESDLYIEPTVILNPPLNAQCMTDEIFGPILPIHNVNSVEEAIDFINSREKPLALYAFSNNLKTLEKVAHETSSGGFVGNDCLIHAAIESMPFGGVGNSGMGSYHGKFSFEAFSHKKPVLIDKSVWMTEKMQGIRYPPYTERNAAVARWILAKSPKKKGFFSTFLRLTLLGFFIAVVFKFFGMERYIPAALKQ